MWPWGHAAVGFVLLWADARVRRRSPLGRGEIVAVLVGTQFPDLVDKPLAWGVALLPSGRSLGHSLVVALPVAVLVVVVARRRGRPALGVAFAVGYVSGILTDVPASVFAGDYSNATFVLWPVLPLPEHETEPSFAAHLLGIELTEAFVLQAIVGLAVGALVVYEYRHAVARD